MWNKKDTYCIYVKLLPVPDIEDICAGQSNAAYFCFHVLLFFLGTFSSIDWH
jgi:hypothetical protein